MDIEITTEPSQTAEDFVTLASVKEHMRIVNSRRDNDLTAKINAVYDRLARPADNMLNRTIAQTTFTLHLPRFPTGRFNAGDDAVIYLPYPPLQSVTAVRYLDASDTLQTLSTDDYIVRSGDQKVYGEIERTTTVWPTPKDHPRAVQIEFVAGYDEVPADFVLLVKLMVAHYDANSEATLNEPRQMAVNRKVEFGHDYLVSKLRVPSTVVDEVFAT